MGGFKAIEEQDFISTAGLFNKYHDYSSSEICM